MRVSFRVCGSTEYLLAGTKNFQKAKRAPEGALSIQIRRST
jgi:hypothetical protein